jgi:hypothetical protein
VWRGLLVGLVLLVGLGPAAGHAQTAPSDQPVAGEWVYAALANPCHGWAQVALATGQNPYSLGLGTRLMRSRPFWAFFPVLAELAANPTLADDPRVLLERMGAQIRAGTTGGSGWPRSSMEAAQWLEQMEAAARMATWSPADAPSGWRLLAAILDDPDLGPA